MHPQSIQDRAWFLKKQVEQLSKLKHNLTQITFVIPEYKAEPLSFSDYVKVLPTHIGTAEVVVYRRPNVGMSYGSFSDVYNHYGDEFDYYFFLEDDYFFVENNFDKTFIEEMESRKDCGYLCMHMGNGGGVYKMHAAVPMGCISSKALSIVRSRHGYLPHSTSSTDYTSNEAGQVEFGYVFWEAGLLQDFKNKYRVPISFVGRLVTIYEENNKEIIVCAQRLDQLND